MPNRMFLIPAACLWLVAHSWLITTKIWPSFSAGHAPEFGDVLPDDTAAVPPVKWDIRWNGKDIGWAENQISRAEDGTGLVRSEVCVQKLQLDTMLRDLLGVAAALMAPLPDLGPLDLNVVTELHFDSYDALTRFDTRVVVGEPAPVLRLRIDGQVADQLMDLKATIEAEGEQTPQPVFRRRGIRLPQETSLTDSFSPRPQMANLRVGQRWSFQSYRPLMPHSPLQVIEATVAQEELIEWHGQMVRTRKVVFRRDAGSGVSVTRQPLSESWVRLDGTVLRRDLRMAKAHLQFIRAAE